MGTNLREKLLNTICQFIWDSLLELDLGVMNTQLTDSKDIYLSIRFRVTIT